MEKKLINWDEHYSVGYKIFDDQHKQLVEMINELYAAFLSGEALEKAPAIVSKMVGYTDSHFKSEEKYFDKYNFPFAEEHKAIHRSFVEKALELKNGLESGKVTVSYDIMNFLRQWLIEHIMGEDQKYKEFFKENNIQINEEN
ncbi:MAG: hemerythrin family protein [Chlorobi bacterium]|nr:hemerythrin family protein [Chlorobiota bacterium]